MINGTTSTKTYTPSFVYNENILEYALFEEGRLVVESNVFKYQYFLKVVAKRKSRFFGNHLGNTRVTFSGNTGLIQQQDHYYPFGMNFSGIANAQAANIANQYKYNGKVLQADLDLNWYDYGARFYDPMIVRTPHVDPHAENFYSESPYSFLGNNPIANIDPTGMDWYTSMDGSATMWQKGSAEVEGYTNIGATYTQNISVGTIKWLQHEPVEITENVLTPDNWQTQRADVTNGEAADANGNKVGPDGNCFVESGKMVKASGAESLPTPKDNISDTEGGIGYLDSQIDQGKSVRVQVDRTGDDNGDHWVAISSRTTEIKTQTTKSYGFYDPGTIHRNAGTSKNNTLSLKSGQLSGTTQYSGKIYKVTDVRKNKQP